MCLRTSNSEYNQSFVADRIAKYGLEATRTLLESWMANDPLIVSSDAELLAVIAAGDCDIGLTNHYYLGRALEEDPDFPVAPAWPDQDGRGAHANVSGVGVVKASDRQADAIAADRVADLGAGAGRVRGRQRVPGQPGGAPERAHPRLGGHQDRPDRRRPRPGRCSTTRSALMLEVGWN